MPVYILHPEAEPKIELVQSADQLVGTQGKFLYFSPIDTLVVADSLELYHKDIFLHVQALAFRSVFLPCEHPDGYGRLENGQVVSWVSQYFGETTKDMQRKIERLL